MPIPNTQLNDYERRANALLNRETAAMLLTLIREVRAMQAVVHAADHYRCAVDVQGDVPHAMGALRNALDDYIGTGPRTPDDGPDVWQENEQLRHLLFRVANEMRLTDMYQLPDDLRQELEEYRDEEELNAIEARAEALHKVRAERAALRDLLAEPARVQDASGWALAHPHLRGDVQKALRGHYSSNDNLEYALDLLGRVVSGWEGGFSLDMDTLADIRAFLKNVEV